ncbi:MAG: PIG-L family deacetylase [Firmicutes bacterium]|nr:PIG-L family deacetylase [Bacillota bacterium]
MLSTRRILAGLLCLAALWALLIPGAAASPAGTEDITGSTGITGTGFHSLAFLTDGNIDTYRSSSGSASLTLTNGTGMAGLYLLFDREYGVYTVTDNGSGKSITAGEGGFLHEFLDLAAAFGTAPTSVTLDFSNGSVRLSEIRVFSGTDVPKDIQVWGSPLEGGADLVLFATHGDDDQLFFAGLLPLYAGAKGCRVQVVYLTDHRNLTSGRIHEMLNGLWAVGVTAYPVFGSFADFRIDSLEGTYDEYRYSYGTTREALQSFVVEQIRRFKPLVAVGHDLNGEYGHGMHMVYADLLTKAVPLTGDPEAFPESAGRYGVWEIPKVYLHLYAKNPITIDYDQPLEAFGGLTAFQATQKLGYPCHKSQQYTWFTRWINGSSGEITKASQIETYSPCRFGLYHSTVGADVTGGDFLENIVPYAEQERLEQERLEQERLEQERLEQERLEQERLEQERLEQERLEQERLEQERLEQERLEQERLESERQNGRRKQELIIAAVLLIVLIIVLWMTVSALSKRKRRKKKR